MSGVLGIKFKDYGQTYYYDSGAFVVGVGDRVLVETDQGLALGTVSLTREIPPAGMEDQELKPIFRLAGPDDLASESENKALAAEAFKYCRERIRERELEMKLVEVEVFFDRGKMLFYFTAPGRVDFRDLVKDLVREYRTRIELRQIGVRHETQMLGAIGNCGQMCCCRRFLRKFEPVTIKMAKEQNLFLNPAKISGICGRLLCCLGYEQENYERFQKDCPKVGKRFKTAIGPVKVLRTNFFRKTISILPEGQGEREVSIEEWQDLLSRKPEDMPPAPQPGAGPPKGRDLPRKPHTQAGDAPRSEVSASETAQSGEPGSESLAKPGSKGRGRKRPSRRRRRRKPKPSE